MFIALTTLQFAAGYGYKSANEHEMANRSVLDAVGSNAKYLCILVLLFLSGCSPSEQPRVSGSQQTVTASALSLLDGIELKKASDIEPRIKMVKDSSIEELARAIADVDEWLFTVEDEKPARERIETEIEELGVRIESEVANLARAAVSASNGKVAAGSMGKITSLINLYPAPKTDAQRTKLEKIASSILSTSRRLEDIRRLRYNEWALAQIQQGLANYRNELKIKGIRDITKLVKTDKDALIGICINSISAIDPGFLEPAVMDLYNYFFGLTRDAIGSDDDNRVKLSKGFSNPKTVRRTSSDF